MDHRIKPSPRLQPLPVEHTPELKAHFEAVGKNLGLVPNSVLIMQRKPKMVQAFAQMAAAIWDPAGKVDRRLKRLIAHVASRAAGCQYCMAHTIPWRGQSRNGTPGVICDIARFIGADEARISVLA